MRPRVMTSAVDGHFGELLQGRMGPDGPVALITLPCPVLQVKARYIPSRDFRIHSPDRLVTPSMARKLLAQLRVAPRGRFALRAEMPTRAGAGASTAALVALAKLVAPWASPDDIASACLSVEGASDPVMYQNPERILWASRQARAIEPLGTLPRFDVIGGFYGPPVETDAKDVDFADISDLVSQWRKAVADQDLPTLAQLSSQAAERTLDRRGPTGDPTATAAQDLGALGYAIAHTGNARALLFAPGTAPKNAAAYLRECGFTRVISFPGGSK